MFIIADIMRNCSVESQFIENIPRQTRFRSVPDVVVLNSQLLAKLLIKCQRLPRGFFWNDVFPPLVCNTGKGTKQDR